MDPSSACADDRRDDGARRLARPVGVEGPQHRDREVERAVEAVHQLVGRDLARRVRGLRLERMVLGDGDGLRRSVHLARRGVHDALHPVAKRRLGDIQRPEHVDLDEVARVDVRVRDGDLRAEVQHDLGALDGGRDRLHVAQLAARRPPPRPHRRFEPVERAAVVARVVAAHGPHPGAVAHEPLDEMAADESARAGHEDRLACQSRHRHKHPTASCVSALSTVAACPGGPFRLPMSSCRRTTSRRLPTSTARDG